jgi:hypothetical protein
MRIPGTLTGAVVLGMAPIILCQAYVSACCLDIFALLAGLEGSGREAEKEKREGDDADYIVATSPSPTGAPSAAPQPTARITVSPSLLE